MYAPTTDTEEAEVDQFYDDLYLWIDFYWPLIFWLIKLGENIKLMSQNVEVRWQIFSKGIRKGLVTAIQTQ